MYGGIHRSTKAGAETPATRPDPCVSLPRSASLNEGRGRDPGDTAAGPAGEQPDPRRSTKAGAETPATLLIGAEHLHGCDSKTGLPTPDRNLTTGSAVFGCGCRHKPADVLEICDESQL